MLLPTIIIFNDFWNRSNKFHLAFTLLSVCSHDLCMAYQLPALMLFQLLVLFTILVLYLNLNNGVKFFSDDCYK
jgi:hypothetical protein